MSLMGQVSDLGPSWPSCFVFFNFIFFYMGTKTKRAPVATVYLKIL
jgi:hypothetical protein